MTKPDLFRLAHVEARRIAQCQRKNTKREHARLVCLILKEALARRS